MPLYILFDKTSEGGGKLSNNYMLHLHRLLSSILEKAVKWQVLLYNPCRRIEAPKVPPKEAAYYDEYQTQDMLACLQNELLKYRAMVIVLLYTGMRRGNRWLPFVTGYSETDSQNGYAGIFGQEIDAVKIYVEWFKL